MTKEPVDLPKRSVLAKHWNLDPEVVFLNHGSFEVPCPERMIGSMAAIPLPSRHSEKALPMGGMDPLQERLFGDFSIEVPVTLWSDPRRRAVRISAHLYNTIEEFRYLGAGLAASALD